jgi:hypothetical protein
VSFYVSTATFFLLHCDEWDRVVALPRHKFVTGATLLQLLRTVSYGLFCSYSTSTICHPDYLLMTPFCTDLLITQKMYLTSIWGSKKIQARENDWLMEFHPNNCQVINIMNKRKLICQAYNICHNVVMSWKRFNDWRYRAEMSSEVKLSFGK